MHVPLLGLLTTWCASREPGEAVDQLRDRLLAELAGDNLLDDARRGDLRILAAALAAHRREAIRLAASLHGGRL